MARIILDCDLMKHRNSGLYQYCLNIGNYVNHFLKDSGSPDNIRYYVPASESNAFDNPDKCIIENKYHKIIRPFLWDCDIWHAPFQSGRIVPRGNNKIRVLLTIHDLNCLHEGHSREQQKSSLAHTQDLIDHADAIVCISEFCKSDVLKHCEVGNKPVYVIHNGTHRLHQARLNKVSYKPRVPFLFGLGYVNRKKNFHVLLPLLIGNNYEFIIAGKLDEPDYIKLMEKKAKALGISDRLHVLGPVNEEEKAWYLQNCLAYVHPSVAEGFGAPVVEAMAYGKPLFLSSNTSLPEIAGDVGFYFSNFEEGHICNVFQEGMMHYQQNGLSGRIIQKGNEYNWEQKAAQYAAVYQSLSYLKG
ncbi:MAG: glycosyltransferase family 1 protein [Ferruginibacter sp.]